MGVGKPGGSVGRTVRVAAAAWLILGVLGGAPAAAVDDPHLVNDDDLLGGDDDDSPVNDTLDTTTDTVEETTDTTTDTVEETTGTTTDTVEETTDTTTDTVESTTGATTDTVDGTVDTVSNTTNGTAAEDVTDTVENTTEATTDTVDGTVNATTATTDSTVEATAQTVEGTVETTTRTIEGTVETTTDTLDATTGRVTGTVDATTETVLADPSGGEESTTDTWSVDIEGAAGDDTATAEDTTTGDGTTAGASTTRSSGTAAARLTDPAASGSGVPTAPAVDDGEGDDGDGAANDVDGGSGTTDDGPLDRATAFASDAFVTASTVLGTAVDAVPGDETGVAAGAVAVAAVGAGAAARQSSLLAGTGGAETGLLAARTAAQGAAETGKSALGRLVRMVAPFRYSQYDDSDPLELEARRSVYEAVREQPGEPITAVSERADVNLSTARYHVRVLRKEDLITSARVRNCERFYPTGTDNLEVAAAMADDTTAPLLDALVRHEPASVSTLADDLDKSPSTVTHHLQNLEEDGVVVRERAGRSVENKLSEPARAALDPTVEAEDSLPTAADLRAETEIEAESEAGTGAHAD